MENTNSVYEKIDRLRREKDVLILAHLYQSLDIQRVADYTGDSFELARRAKESDRKNIVFCGVKFMAESAKIMNPDKRVFAPVKTAGCAMADMVTGADVRALKALHPEAAAVCYINSSAETKAECDMCVTSSNALKIIKNMPQKEIIFVPDKNLGAYIAERVPEKTFYIHSGYCPVHKQLTAETVKKARAEYPDAVLLVHPECEKEVIELADATGSTSFIIDYAKKSDKKQFIIGTEKAVYEKLMQECPEKQFILPDENLVCADMKLTTINDLLYTLESLSDETILDGDTMTKARSCLDNMLEAASAQ